MTEQVGAYWGPRSDNPADAAQRMVRLLDVLDVPAWFRLGKSEPDAQDAVSTDAEALTELLSSGRNRRDTDKTVIEELGYSMSLWSPTPPDGIKISAQVGITSTAPGLSNSLLISLPDGHDFYGRSQDIFTALVDTTDPDRAIWATREYRRTQATVQGQAMIGWQTYLTSPLADQVNLVPEGVEARPLKRGTWLVVGDEPGPRSQELAASVADDLLD